MRLNNLRLVALTALLAAGLVLPAMAEVKVAVFDAQLIYSQSNAAKRISEQLRSKQAAANNQIKALETPLIAKQKQLVDQQGVLAADKLKAAEVDLRKDYINFRTQASKISDEFESAQLSARKQLADAMRTAINTIAKEKGYDLILPKPMTLYTGANVPDISSDVLARVNASLK